MFGGLREGVWFLTVLGTCSSCLGLAKPADPVQRPTCPGVSLVNRASGIWLLRQVALILLSILVVMCTYLDIGPNSLAIMHALSNSRVKRKLG